MVIAALGVDIGIVDRPALAALGEAAVDSEAAGAIWEECASQEQTLQVRILGLGGAPASAAAPICLFACKHAALVRAGS